MVQAHPPALAKMGLALLDVADVIRPYLEVIDYLQHLKDDNFLDELVRFDGGQFTKKFFNNTLKRVYFRFTVSSSGLHISIQIFTHSTGNVPRFV